MSMRHDNQLLEKRQMTDQATKPEATFEPIAGDTVTVVAEPTDPSMRMAQTITVERGTYTDKEGNVKPKAWFRGSINGNAGRAASTGASAVVSALTTAGVGKKDDYIFDLETEELAAFFSPPKQNTPSEADVWERDDAATLQELRIKAQTEFEAAQDSEAAMQRAWYNTAVMMQGVLDETFEGNAKAFTAWAKGREGDDSAPVIRELGNKGVNALSEARVFAQFSDVMLAFVPNGVARGKAVAKYRNEAINMAFDALVYEAGKRTKFKADDGKLAEKVRKTMAKLFSSDEFDFDAISGHAWDRVQDGEASYNAAKVDGFSDEQRKDAQMILGDVFMVDMLNDYLWLENNYEKLSNTEGSDSLLKKAAAEVTKCEFVKRLMAAQKRKEEAQEREGNEKAAQKELDTLNEAVDTGESFVPEEEEKSTFQSTPATQVAAQLFNTMMAHPAYERIMEHMEALFAEQRSIDAANADSDDE